MSAKQVSDAFARRRQKLLDGLGDGLLILPTAEHQIRNGDVHHAFRPGSDFHYLTGFPEPEAILVAWRTGRGTHHSQLYVLPRDKARETWDGKRFGVQGAVKEFLVDEAFPIQEFRTALPRLLDDHEKLFHTLGVSPEFDARLMKAFGSLSALRRRRNPAAHPVIEDARPKVAAMRLIKDREELDVMQRAADVTAEAHCAAMRGAKPGMTEYQVQALLEGVFRESGSRRNGYESIVASGANACVLHYIENSRKMRRGDLLLVDAGAEVEHYTADITRTWPIGGEGFSKPQRAVYDIVLKAQKAAIAAIKPGKPWNIAHTVSLREITKGLVKLGFLKGKVSDLVGKDVVGKEPCRQWFMHGTSHWLGRDVHDVGAYEDDAGKPVALRAGMVLTVEPGLYFDPQDKSVPKEFRGIGVRIEDDVAVTTKGSHVLTSGVPKDVREVEAMCRGEEPS